MFLASVEEEPVRHETLPTARSARSVSAFYSIAYVTQRTKEEEEEGSSCLLPASSSPPFVPLGLLLLPVLPRIVTIRSCGNNVECARSLLAAPLANRLQL